MPKITATWWQQAVHNKVVAVVLAMAVAVPLVAAPMAKTNTPIAALAFEGFGILLLAMLLWNADWKLDKERVVTFLKTGANLPALLFLGLAVLSCLLSPHKNYSIQETLRIGAGVLLYFVVAYKFRRSEHLSKLVDTLLFVAIAASLVGFAQYAASPAQYATGLFGDHQLFGSFLMILLPIIAVVAITEAKPGRQLAAQIATVLTIACLLITHTRSAWIGAAAGLATLAVLAMIVGARRSRLTGAKHQVVLPVMLMAVAAGFFLLIWPQTSSIVGRATSLSSVSDEAGWNYRQSMWQGTLKMVREKPLTGFGAGLYPYYEQQYTGSGVPISCMGGDRPDCPSCSVSGLIAAANPGESSSAPSPPVTARRKVMNIYPTLGEQAHNFYLQTAAELGIPGLLCVIAVLAVFLGQAVRQVRRMDAGSRRSLLIGAVGSIVAFAIDAGGSPSWQLGQVSMFFWMILGLGVSCTRPKPTAKEERPQAVPVRLSRRPVTALVTVGLVALLPIVVFACPTPQDNYGTVSNAQLTTVQSPTIASGSTVNFHATVDFSNPTPGQTPTQPVTCCSLTAFKFTKVSGPGGGTHTAGTCLDSYLPYTFTTAANSTTVWSVHVLVTYNPQVGVTTTSTSNNITVTVHNP